MKGLRLGELKIKFEQDGKTVCDLVDRADDQEIAIKNLPRTLREPRKLSIIIDNIHGRNSEKKKVRNTDEIMYKLQLMALQMRISELARSKRKMNKKE